VPRKFICLALFSVSLSAPLSGSAQTSALLAVDDAKQVSELQLAKVMADDSSLWLSVRLHGPSRLALVIAESAVVSAPSAHAWLGALDFATRVRVAAPTGAPSSCGASEPLQLADSGMPESRRVAAVQVSSANSELELRRVLADAELPAEIDRVAQFTSRARPPFRISIYDVSTAGGSTETLRFRDHGHPGELPRIALSGARSLPLSLIALADQGVLPLAQESADPSEFPVVYRGQGGWSDYLAARAGWLAQNPSRWLNEVQSSGALFAWTVLRAGGRIAPVVSRYFEQLSGMSESACELRVRAAHARASLDSTDFVCDGADDLSQALRDVGFADLRLSRFFGELDEDGASFRVVPGVPRSPLVVATDFDGSGCPAPSSPPANAPSNPPDSRTPPVSTPPVVSGPDDPYYDPSKAGSSVSRGEVSCGATAYDSRSNGSCSGDSSSNSGRDSCSGDSSASDSSDDSCSGDSSSDDSGPNSCSGDASHSGSDDGCSGDTDSSSDSSGCGKSEYDGDTCGGSSESNSARSSRAGLRSGSARARARPRQVRLSLLTLLAAALALPLRRLRASR
jgi:hypothetical protein